MTKSFVHLHVHSEYSLLDGASRIKTLVQAAKEQGMSALAITDHGSMYGVIPFYKACREQNIKPIIGVEVYVTNSPLEAKAKKGEFELYHLLLLAKNYRGYQNLMHLTTKAHLEGFYYKPRVTKQWLKEHSEGLICLSGCLASELQQALLHQQTAKASAIIKEYQDIFGDAFYLELQDHGMLEQKKVNHQLIQLASEHQLPLVATNDVHYVYQKDAFAHDCLLCIGTNKKVAEQDRLKFPNDQFYLKSTEEMHLLFKHVPEAITNTQVIAEQCQLEIPFGVEILPHYPLQEGETAEAYLRQLCLEGARKRYADITSDIQTRLDYELKIINQMGYEDYFLIVWDFMRFAHENGIITGPGRGSAAGSLVAYVLNITNIDPIKYNLLFERFLNPERVTMPDIDIDFSDRRRDEVIQYVAKKYGYERVAQIITFGTMGAKAAIRDVGRVLNIPLPTVNRFAKLIPSSLGITLEKAYQESPQLRKLITEDEHVRHLYEVARDLEGTARHTSIHAAGVVISKEPLPQVVPLQEGHENVALTQYAMEDLEDLGLLKMDFLGLRNLSLLEEIISIVNETSLNQHSKVSLDSIPFDDEATFTLLSQADTAGIFQLESEGMKNVLKRLKPSCFEDIIAVLALYRPGPMENIPLFIDAKHGKTKVEYSHPDLKPILEDTYGIIVYQEQIMQIASKLAGFSLGEADLLRRAVGKKKREILEQEREHFVQGCLAQGYNKQVAEHVYDLIVRFADYGFNRSHSAAYAVIAYQLAYLKTHYPVAFLASLLSTSLGHTEKLADYLSQAARRGIQVLPPSVQSSMTNFTVEGGHIRIGLGTIKNVGHAVIQEILKERAKRPYKNLLDFCQRVPLKVCNRRVIESLIMAGAFDELDMHRAQALANLDNILTMAEQVQGINASDQLFFFADELPEDYQWIEVPRYSNLEQLKIEKDVLGFYLSGHPLDSYRLYAEQHGVTYIPQLLNMEDKVVRTIALVTKHRQIKTKKGEPMAFIVLEDQGAELEAVVFPTLYSNNPILFQEANLLFIEGKLEEKSSRDEKQFIINKVADLTQINYKELQEIPKDTELYIRIKTSILSTEQLQELKILLQSNEHAGETLVNLYYEEEKMVKTLTEDYKVEVSQALLNRIHTILGYEKAASLQKKKAVR